MMGKVKTGTAVHSHIKKYTPLARSQIARSCTKSEMILYSFKRGYTWVYHYPYMGIGYAKYFLGEVMEVQRGHKRTKKIPFATHYNPGF